MSGPLKVLRRIAAWQIAWSSRTVIIESTGRDTRERGAWEVQLEIDKARRCCGPESAWLKQSEDGALLTITQSRLQFEFATQVVLSTARPPASDSSV